MAPFLREILAASAELHNRCLCSANVPSVNDFSHAQHQRHALRGCSASVLIIRDFPCPRRFRAAGVDHRLGVGTPNGFGRARGWTHFPFYHFYNLNLPISSLRKMLAHRIWMGEGTPRTCCFFVVSLVLCVLFALCRFVCLICFVSVCLFVSLFGCVVDTHGNLMQFHENSMEMRWNPVVIRRSAVEILRFPTGFGGGSMNVNGNYTGNF